MRIIIRGVINNETKTLEEMGLEGKKIKTLCTILDEEKMFTKYNVETGEPYKVDLDNATLLHHRTVFYEDSMHDYTVMNGKFKFHAHSSDIGEAVDLFIEYE